MNKYTVALTYPTVFNFTIEAENEEQAKKMAYAVGKGENAIDEDEEEIEINADFHDYIPEQIDDSNITILDLRKI